MININKMFISNKLDILGEQNILVLFFSNKYILSNIN